MEGNLLVQRYKIIITSMYSSKTIVTLLGLLVLLCAQSCPQLCMTNCSAGTCAMCRTNFSLDAGNSTSCACPASTFLLSSSGLCAPCPITCTACSSYSKCSTCIPGFILSNSYACIPAVINANGWVSKNVSYELTGANLTASNYAIWNNNATINLAQAGNFTSTCSKLPTYNWIGGYGLLGYSAKLTKSLYGLPPHQWLNLRLQVVLIDKWIGNTLLLQLSTTESYSNSMSSSQVIWQASFLYGARFVDFCGNSSIPDNLAVIDAWVPHNLSSAVLRLRLNESEVVVNPSNYTTSYLNQVYFAIRELFIRVGTCGKNCRYCAGPLQCTECILPYTLSGGACVCNSTFGFVTVSGCQANCVNGYYFNATANRCLNCEYMVDNCQTCTSTACITCSLGYFYYNDGSEVQCIRYCPNNYTETRNYTNNSTGNITLMRDQCTPCPTNCRTCNFNICLFCTRGSLYFQGACLATCPQATFASQGSCSRCIPNCLSCSSALTCSTCASGYGLTNSGCSPYCLNTTLISSTTNNTCNHTCFSNCSICFGPNANQCLLCGSGLLLQSGVCTSVCSGSTFASGTQCILCPLECQTCSSLKNCLTCNNGYYYDSSSSNGSCVRMCPPAYYPSQSYNTVNSTQCLPCAAGCERCKSTNFCTQCHDGYRNFNFTCVLSTPAQFYFDRQLHHFKPCQSNCLKCDELVCFKCASGYFLNQGVCVTECGPYKFKKLRWLDNSTQYGFCEWRSPTCALYDSSSSGSCSQCSFFQPSLVQNINYNNATSCFFSCPEFYTQSSSLTCVPCPQNCRRCNQYMQCLECLYNYVINSQDLINATSYFNTSCIPDYCKPPFFSDSVQCQQCSAGCAVCQIDGRCLSCLPTFAMDYDLGACFASNCSVNQYYNSNTNSCQLCITPCLTCSSSYLCTSCVSTSALQLYLFQNSCVTNCPSQYFAHKDSRTCRKCNPKCQTCLSFYNCLTCAPQYYLLSFYDQSHAQCVAECPIGFYSDTQICKSCFRDCRSCYGPSEYQCLTCYHNFVLDDSKCVYQCSSGKYEDEYGHCDWCDSSCNDCNGPTSQNCVSCGLNYYISDHQCFKDECPDATYLAHYEERKCDRCQFGCSRCTSPQFCRFCFPGFGLYRGWCYQKCPGNLIMSTIRFTYLDNIEGYICKDCLSFFSSKCLRCDSRSCTKCPTNYYLYKNSLQVTSDSLKQQCVTSCPLGTFVKSREVRECIACQPNCINCTSYQNCVSCAQTYNLINGYCSTNCPSGMYLTAYRNCSACPTACLGCANASSCSACSQGYYLLQNSTYTCVQTCPAAYFADKNSGKCNKCLPSCSVCTATNNCTQCLSGYSLINSICQNQTTNCPSNCQSCSGQNCFKCSQPYLLYINKVTSVSSCVSACPTGYYSNIFTCQSCNSSCTVCTNSANNCSQCQLGLYLYGQSCISVCPVGYYASATLQLCQSCPLNCINCQQTTCYACQSGFYLLSGQCYAICPVTFYASVSTGTCQNCPSNCATCSPDQNCTVCSAGYLLYNGTCSQNCPMTTYVSTDASSNNSICLPCASSCYTCSDPDTCISCIPNYILNGTSCQAACNAGYYYLTLTLTYDNEDQNYNFSSFTQCYPCDPSCSICSSSATTCQACNSPFILYGTQCLSSCPAGTYLNVSTCISCPAFCLTCNSSSSCQVCANNTVLFSSQCISVCPLGFYMDSAQSQYICQPCSSSCLSCTGPSLYQCTSCSSNLSLTNSGACVSACSIGTYADSQSRACNPCPYSCASCLTFLNCTSCIANYTLTSTNQCKSDLINCTAANCQFCTIGSSTNCSQCMPSFYLSNSACISSCPAGTYSQAGQCLSCSSNCLNCAASGCLICNNVTYLYQGSCINSCPTSTFASVGSCQTDPCLAYNSLTNDCLQCASPYLLYAKALHDDDHAVTLQICVLTCPSGSIQSGSTCVVCPQNCRTCISSSVCTQCSADTFLYQSTCQKSCPLGTYAINSVCQSCSLPYCSQCVSIGGVQSCTSCATSAAYLFNGNCVLVCPTGTYVSTVTQTCNSCSQNCISCSSSQCTTCSTAYYLYLGQCISVCPSGTFASGGSCSPCSAGCSQCSSSTTCSMCQSSSSLFAVSANSSYCVGTCPPGYYSQGMISSSYSNSNQFKCVACSSPCLTCISATTCTQCAGNTTLSGTSCVNNCPAGYFISIGQTLVVNQLSYVTNICKICSAACLTCSNTSTYCLSCPSGYLLDANNNCVSNCASSTTYYSQTTRLCYNCSLQCYSCYGPGTDNCLSCRPPLQLYSGSCFSACPFGYYGTAASVCQQCATSCSSCQGTSTNCTSCNTGFFIQAINGVSTCTASCSNGYFLNFATQTCVPCSAVCLTCISSNQCITCASGLYLNSNQTCTTSCPAGTSSIVSNNQFICSPCPVNCLTCIYSSISQSLTCTQCSSNYYLVNGNCSQTCPAGSYPSPTLYSCIDCGIVGCQNCQFTTILTVSCSTCQAGYYIYNGLCVTTCPNGTILSGTECTPEPICQNYQWNGFCLTNCPVGTYPTSTTSNGSVIALSCSNCSAYCTSCTSATSCLSCLNNAYLYSTMVSNSTQSSCVVTCPAGTYILGSACQVCASPCLTCQASSSGVNCISCLSGYFQLGSSCYTNCPLGYYQSGSQCSLCSAICASCSINSTNCLTCKNTNAYAPNCIPTTNCTSSQYQSSNTTCSNCNSACLTCYGGSSYECLSCSNSTNILISGSCVSNCPAGTIRNMSSCISCPANCLNCILNGSSIICNSCASPYILFTSNSSSSCIQSCSSLNSGTQNYLLVNGQCQLCTISGCLLCSYANGQFQCNSCQNSTYLYNQQCMTACPTGTYPSSNTCVSCPQNCQSCTTLGCSVCSNGYSLLNSNCVSSCGQGFYSINSTCYKCSAANCVNCTSTTCQFCQQPYLLDNNGQCSSCISGYFSSSGVCNPCASQCLTCTGSSANCLSCTSGFLVVNSSTCVPNCPSGSYATTAGTCLSCTIANCQSCTSSGCTSCASGYVFVAVGNQVSCQSSCPASMYLSTSTNTCINCSTSCISCSSSISCSACANSSVLYQGYCLSSCPSGFINVNQSCASCPSGCKTCTSSACTSCSTGLTLSNGTCSLPYNNCQNGYYRNTLGGCSQCYTSCNTCIAGNIDNCLTCFIGYTLTNGVCVQNCSIDSFYSITNSSCQLCTSLFANCVSCTNNSCISCTTNYTVLNGNCSLSCPIGTFLSMSTCLSCPAYCLSCTSSSSCSQCLDLSIMLVNGLCYTSCPDQTYQSGNTCKSCYQTCVTCSGTFTNCSSCITPYNLYGNACLAACPNGTFSYNYACQACATNCLLCTGINECTVCSSNYYLINGTCRTGCPSGYYIDTTSNRCLQCTSPCLVCTSRTSCSSCQSPATLSNGMCINANCTSGYYDFSTLSCTSCTVNHCSYCTNSSCSYCIAGYYSIYMNGVLTYCQPACIASTFADNATMNCTSCFQNCFSCVNASWCSICSSGYYLLSVTGAIANECVLMCPLGYYADNSNYQCSFCDSYCLTCINSTNCLICNSNYYKFVSNSSITCVNNCPSMYYTPNIIDGTGECGQCGSNCYACIDRSTCTQCISTSNLIVNGVCTPSNCVHCLTCSFNNNTCSQCASGYYLYNNKCSGSCPDGFYADNSTAQCLGCVSNCLLCQAPNSCMLCISGYVFVNGSSCENAGLIKFGALGNMSGFTSNITKIMAIVYVSTSSGPIAFGAIGSTYGPMQFCQFMYLLQGSSGGNDEMNNFLNSLSAVSYTTSSGTNEHSNSTSTNGTTTSNRLLTAINYTSSFLTTNLPIFLIMISFVGAYFMVLLVERYNQSCCMSCPTVQKYMVYICDFMKRRFKYIYVDEVMWISYLPFLYFAVLQLQSGRFDSGINIFSSLLAIAIIIIYPLYPIFILRKIFDRSSDPAEDLQNYKAITLKQPEIVDEEKGMCENFSCCPKDDPDISMVEMSLSPYIDKVVRPIYNQYDPEYSEFRYFKLQHWRLAYAAIKYVRKFIFVLIVALCSDPVTTLSLLVVITLVYMAYLIILRPKEKLYLVLEIILESVLLFFVIFMLVYVSKGGASVSELSIATHAIGFILANSTLAIAIILNLMAYYTIFCCMVDLVRHLRNRAIEDDEKMKQFAQIVEDKEKIDYKDKDKEDIEIRKSLRRGDDEMTVENNDEENYVPYDLDEKEFNVRSSMINKKKKTFEDDEPEEDFSNLKSTKNPKARQNRRERRKSQKLEEESHTSEEIMGQSKISEQDVADGLLKDRNTKFKREVNKDDVTVDRGEIKQPADKFRRRHHKEKDIGPQEQESMDTLKPDARRPVNEFVVDIDTHDRMVPSKKEEYIIDPTFIERQAKRREKPKENDDIDEPYMREREGKNTLSKPNDPLEGAPYDRQIKQRTTKEKDIDNGFMLDRPGKGIKEKDIENGNMADRPGRNIKQKDIDNGNMVDRTGKNSRDKDIDDGNMVDRAGRKKQNPYGIDDPADINQANTYNRQPKSRPEGSQKDVEGKSYSKGKDKDNLLEANTYDRKREGKNSNNQNEKELESVSLAERERKKKEANPFGEFDEIFAQEEDSKAVKEAEMQERARKQKENSLSGQKLISGFVVDEANTVQRKNQQKKFENLHYKGSDEQEIVEGQAVEAKGNKFKRNVKKPEKSNPQEADIDAYGRDIKTKRIEKIQSTKQFVEDSLAEAKYKERQGKQLHKLKSLNEKAQSAAVEEASAFNRDKRVAEKKKKESEQDVENIIYLSPSPVKPNKAKPNIYDNLDDNLAESIQFREEKPVEAKKKASNDDPDFEEVQNGAKILKAKAQKQKRPQDNRMQVSENIEESYDDIVKKNKQNVFKQTIGNKSNLIDLENEDDFEEVTYSRPESKIERPKSRSKDMGLGVNSRAGSEASDNESRDIRKQRNSAIQRQRKKANLNINDNEASEDNQVGTDSRRLSKIVRNKSKLKGVLNIEDKSDNEDIEHVQL